MEITIEEKIFNLIDKLGESMDGEIHVFENIDGLPCDNEKTYRVYHNKGYCFDVKKEVNTEDEKTGEPIDYYYSVYMEWEGFDNNINLNNLYELLVNKPEPMNFNFRHFV